MEKRADSLFDYAVSVTGCPQPLIALNELWGSWLPMPLTPTAERYRENVLRFVSRLSERGARPALLVSGDPFTGGGAGAWWKAMGQVSDLVLAAMSRNPDARPQSMESLEYELNKCLSGRGNAVASILGMTTDANVVATLNPGISTRNLDSGIVHAASTRAGTGHGGMEVWDTRSGVSRGMYNSGPNHMAHPTPSGPVRAPSEPGLTMPPAASRYGGTSIALARLSIATTSTTNAHAVTGASDGDNHSAAGARRVNNKEGRKSSASMANKPINPCCPNAAIHTLSGMRILKPPSRPI